MSKNIFTPDFYKRVADEIVRYRDSDLDGFEPEETYVVSFDTEDGISVEVCVQYGSEWHDDSFDHAFGTWHDPSPYYVPTNIDWIGDVTVWDEDGNVVDGFDIDAFWAQFETDERKGHKRGDTVYFKNGRETCECEFLGYITENGMYKVRYDGNIKYVSGLCKKAA